MSIAGPSFSMSREVLDLASQIKLLIFDVDGVLTDGSLYLGDDGQEYKAFHTRDGHGIKMLQKSGVDVALITGRTSKVVEHRVADLGIHHLYQGRQEKLPAYEGLLNELGLDHFQAGFVGDDVVDLPIMLATGLSVAVQDAHPLVRQYAHWTTPSPGGRGAARDICEMILFAQGNYDTQIQCYLG